MSVAAVANSAGSPPLIERADVHKSCKMVETIVNLLNDYCESTNALCGIQKRLYKALKDASQVKGATEASVNAFSSTSTMFESIAEVDAKFSKVVDKECEGVTVEVRKWFKKLAKEEKAHDERIMSANDRIKQAGQTFERVAKRKNSPALEEHNRYMNVIASVGPEISQEKYNHTLFVTQRQVAIVMNLCACIARVADAEWTRQCEKVRRSSSSIGVVGHWRAFCEGAWTGSVPPDLPDADTMQDTTTNPPGYYGNSREGSNETRLSSQSQPEGLLSTPPRPRPVPSPNSNESFIPHPRRLSPLPSPSATPSDPPPILGNTTSIVSATTSTSSDFDPSTVKSAGPGFDTITASFPAPPTHTEANPNTPGSKIRKRQPSLAAINDKFSESGESSAKTKASTADRVEAKGAGLEKEKESETKRPMSPEANGNGSRVAAIRDKYDRSNPASPVRDREEAQRSQGRDVPTRRTSVHIAEIASKYDPSQSQTAQQLPPTQSPGSLPPRHRESQSNTTPFPTTGSPVAKKNILPSSTRDRNRDTALGIALSSEPDSMTLPSGSAEKVQIRDDDDGDPTIRAVNRRRRINELQALQFEEQEYILKEEERRLQEKARELEREKERLQSGRTEFANASAEDGAGDLRAPSRPYRLPSYSASFTQIPSATSTSATPGSPTSKHGKLVAPRKPRASISGSTSTTSLNQVSSYASSSGNPPMNIPNSSYVPATPGHDLDCNCVSCVLHRPPPNNANHVPTSPAVASHLRPQKAEKPKGWIRRLSMPVGAAFSLSDSSKKAAQASVNTHGPGNVGYYGIGSGIGSKDVGRMALSGLPPPTEEGAFSHRPGRSVDTGGRR